MSRLAVPMKKVSADFAKRTFPFACVAAGLPEPVEEHRFHPTRKWRFDYAWPEWKVALEVEGGVFTGGRHVRGVGAIADMQKYSEAAVLGWLVLRLIPRDLLGTGVGLVARALTVQGCPVPAAALPATPTAPAAKRVGRQTGPKRASETPKNTEPTSASITRETRKRCGNGEGRTTLGTGKVV